MDGHFVPNLTFGPMIVKAIRKLARAELDVHLMISNPEAYIERFVESGSNYLTFHIEAVERATELLERAKLLGVKVGFALNPQTDLSRCSGLLEIADIVVIMTVNPGFGGQSFMYEVVPKIRDLYMLKNKHNYEFDIEVDGGINVTTAPIAAWAGADILVAGAAVFKSGDPAKAVKDVLEAAATGASRRDDPDAFPLAPQ